jgi:hypothetical protein
MDVSRQTRNMARKRPDTKNVCWVGGQPRVEKLRKKNKQKYE